MEDDKIFFSFLIPYDIKYFRALMERLGNNLPKQNLWVASTGQELLFVYAPKEDKNRVDITPSNMGSWEIYHSLNSGYARIDGYELTPGKTEVCILNGCMPHFQTRQNAIDSTILEEFSQWIFDEAVKAELQPQAQGGTAIEDDTYEGQEDIRLLNNDEFRRILKVCIDSVASNAYSSDSLKEFTEWATIQVERLDKVPHKEVRLLAEEHSKPLNKISIRAVLEVINRFEVDKQSKMDNLKEALFNLNLLDAEQAIQRSIQTAKVEQTHRDEVNDAKAKSKRGPRSTLSKIEKGKAYKEWNELDPDRYSGTLEDWLENKFGGQTDGTLNVPPATFYGWKRYLNLVETS